MTAPARFPAETVRAALDVLHPDGGVIEVRILNTPRGTVSGYFGDKDRLVKAVAPYDGTANIYVTLNPVLPDLLARAQNRLKVFAKVTTKDAEILSRQWLPLDLDAVRPADISSTDEELAAAIAKRDKIVSYLCNEGAYPEMVQADSGNGAHALVRCSFSNTPDITALFQRALHALAHRFDDAQVKIDPAVFNAARIWKLYGTIAATGDPIPTRPHRRAEITSAPDSPVLLTREQLEWLADQAPVARTYSVPSERRYGELNMLGEFQRRDLYLKELAPPKHAVTCPWQEQHSTDSGPSETVLFEPTAPGDPWGFDCKHAHCSERTIKDVLALFWNGNEQPATPRVSRAPLLLASEIQAAPVSYCIEEIAPRGMLGILSGKDKRGKTLLGVEMAKALLLGEPFLGVFPTSLNGTVAAFLLDDPDSLTIQRLKDAGIYHHPRLFLCTASRVDLSDPKKALADMLTEVKRVGADFVLVDALYQFIPTTGRDADKDPSRIGPVMAAFNRMTTDTGTTVLLIAHDTKAGGDVAGSYVIRASAKVILRLMLPKQDEEPEDDGPLTPDRVLRVESKLTASQAWRLEILGDRERYEGWAYHGTTTEANTKATYTAVETHLKEHKTKHFTVPELARELRKRDQAVRGALTVLEKGGQVKCHTASAERKRGRPTTEFQWVDLPAGDDLPSAPRAGNSSLQVPATIGAAVSKEFPAQNPALGDENRDENSQEGVEEVPY